MTKEEAIKGLKVLRRDFNGYKPNEEMFDMAIKALEQQSCEPKMGHWNRVTDKTGHLVWECDKCGWQQPLNTNFCPDCGVKMQEVSE